MPYRGGQCRTVLNNDVGHRLTSNCMSDTFRPVGTVSLPYIID